MKLSEVLKFLSVNRLSGAACTQKSTAGQEEQNDPCRTPCTGSYALRPDPEIGSIHYRSQDVRPGGLFIAIAGFKADGHNFIDDALAKGAAAVVTQNAVNKDAIIIEVENTRYALADISARFFGNPSEQLRVIGITGTNGKTTTSYLIESILAKAGCRVGMIGTINYRYSGKTFVNPVTTPESFDLQRILAEMRKEGITHVVMEVSSHAIDLGRIRKCWFDVGVFTNLTQDHLDFHKDMESYWACKKRLFTESLASGPKRGGAAAVINCNDPRGKELFGMLPFKKLSIGRSNQNMIWPQSLKIDQTGIAGQIVTPGGTFDFRSSLVGAHNLENILCATGVGLAQGIPLNTIKAGLQAVSCVPGRLENIADDSGRFVYVDYAHTPDALANVLSALKAVSAGKIVCIFGCGGDRDPDKRPKMGAIAIQHSDLAIITSDNPRMEEPMMIIQQIVRGIDKASLPEYTPAELKAGFETKGYVIEPDRRKAIKLGITVSSPGDIVLIAGKGHETYQVIGSQTVPFDDRQEAKSAIESGQKIGGKSLLNRLI